MIIQILSLIVIVVVTIVIIIDIIPIFLTWIGRIHIGRYVKQDVWESSIRNKGIQWLARTPKIQVTDQTRLVFLDMLKGNYTKSVIQHWQEASLLLGMSEHLKQHEDHEIKAVIKKYLERNFTSDGQWIHRPQFVDSAILAYALLKLEVIEPNRYRPVFDTVWQLIQDHIGEDGTVQYRKSMKDYRYVDTIGFICPFLVAYGVRYGKEECIDLAMKQIWEYEKYGMLQPHFIPSHAYHIHTKVPLGLYGWGRGLGWFAIGLIDAWNELPMTKKSLLEQSVRRFARSARSFQQKNGQWNWSVSRHESRADSSATATLAWFMVNAAEIEDIRDECSSSAELAISYLMKVTRRNGAVDFSQGDTKDIGVYSMLFNIMPFTQGFSIRNMNKYLQLKSS